MLTGKFEMTARGNLLMGEIVLESCGLVHGDSQGGECLPLWHLGTHKLSAAYLCQSQGWGESRKPSLAQLSLLLTSPHHQGIPEEGQKY